MDRGNKKIIINPCKTRGRDNWNFIKKNEIDVGSNFHMSQQKKKEKKRRISFSWSETTYFPFSFSF